MKKTSADYVIKRSQQPFLHPGISADIFIGETLLGSFGKVHPLVCKNFDIGGDVYYAEINDDILSGLPAKKISTKPISKFPIVERDIAVVVDEAVTNEDMEKSIKSACGNLYYSVNLFDIYRSENLGQSKKSMAYKIKLSDLNKTLTDEEVNKAIQKVLKSLQYKFGAVLR